MVMELQNAFNEIGARLAAERAGRGFEIDIVTRDAQELYQLQRPWNDPLTVEVVDLHPRLRHLVLDVTGWRLPIAGRCLCGHDESHWFVAGLAFTPKTGTVRGAMESLKPDVVLREQRRMGVRHRKDRRKTAAYVRQGEWFFLPRPKMRVDQRFVERNSRLVRNNGKPHHVDELFRAANRDEVFVRGRVRHADHETIELDIWHRVVRNNEPEPAPASRRSAELQRVAWLD